MYGGASRDEDEGEDTSTHEDVDVEAEIAKELEDIRKPAKELPFRHIRVDTDCSQSYLRPVFSPTLANVQAVMFFKTRAPIEPVEFVRRICEDAMASSERKTGRFVKRLTPMTLMGKASQNGLEEVAAKVLAPHFHAEGSAGKKASSSILVVVFLRSFTARVFRRATGKHQLLLTVLSASLQ